MSNFRVAVRSQMKTTASCKLDARPVAVRPGIQRRIGGNNRAEEAIKECLQVIICRKCLSPNSQVVVGHCHYYSQREAENSPDIGNGQTTRRLAGGPVRRRYLRCSMIRLILAVRIADTDE